ncbi:MAG: AtpZ/AtpI family protein [Candidatus Izemoplasma sp.]
MNDKQRDALKVYSIVSGFVFEIIVAVGVMTALGYFLDELFNTVVVFKIIFIIIGVFAGIRNLIVRVSRLEDPYGK